MFALFVLLGLSLGCLGPGADDSRCEGVVTHEGKTYVGKAKDEDRAALNACNKFCVETDKEFQAMYQIWLDSDEARAFEESRKRKPTREDAAIENEKLLDYVTRNCAVRCKNEANKGKHTLEASCKN